MENEYELVHSPLSGKISGDSLTVEVFIYRGKDAEDEWSLEIVDHEGGSTVWDDTFKTDKAAFDGAMLTIETEGIVTFLHDPKHSLN